MDITGERPNCFIELGYTLGRMRPVIVKAMQGTPLPFDEQAVSLFLLEFRIFHLLIFASHLPEFIKKYLNRPPLVV
jgi:hypothetical protein